MEAPIGWKAELESWVIKMRITTIKKVPAIEIIVEERMITLKTIVRYIFLFFTLSAIIPKNGCMMEVKMDIPKRVVANVFGSIWYFEMKYGPNGLNMLENRSTMK